MCVDRKQFPTPDQSDANDDQNNNNNHESSDELENVDTIVSLPIISRHQLTEEEKICRKFGWFAVRYFDSETLAGDRTRYVFVNESTYGLRWKSVSFFSITHILAVYYVYTMIMTQCYFHWFICFLLGMIGGLGSTAGAHRLWSHKTYEASVSVRIFLMLCFTSAGQLDIHNWSRDHRLHHKFTETDADPHNPLRGWFYAHIGWLLTKRHPDVTIKGQTIDYSDLMNDPVVRFNIKYYVPLYLLLRVYLCTMIPHWISHEPLSTCITGSIAQYLVTLHTIWFVNSAAHMLGERPYNNKIRPTDNFFVAITSLGEGFHNYHHVFPWDYTVAEYGISYWNPATWFIDAMSSIGLCSNLKRPSRELVDKVLQSTKGSRACGVKEFYVYDHPFVKPHNFTDDS